MCTPSDPRPITHSKPASRLIHPSSRARLKLSCPRRFCSRWEECMEDTYRAKQVNSKPPAARRLVPAGAAATGPRAAAAAARTDRRPNPRARARRYQQPTKRSGNKRSPLTLRRHQARPAPGSAHLAARFSPHANRNRGREEGRVRGGESGSGAYRRTSGADFPIGVRRRRSSKPGHRALDDGDGVSQAVVVVGERREREKRWIMAGVIRKQRSGGRTGTKAR